MIEKLHWECWDNENTLWARQNQTINALFNDEHSRNFDLFVPSFEDLWTDKESELDYIVLGNLRNVNSSSRRSSNFYSSVTHLKFRGGHCKHFKSIKLFAIMRNTRLLKFTTVGRGDFNFFGDFLETLVFEFQIKKSLKNKAIYFILFCLFLFQIFNLKYQIFFKINYLG